MRYNEPSKVPAGRKIADINSERYTWLMSAIVGLPVTCKVRNGNLIEALFHTFDANVKGDGRGHEICLFNAQEVAQADKPSGDIQPKLIISMNDIVSMHVRNVPLRYTKEDLEREKKSKGIIVESERIQKDVGGPRPDRVLQKWYSEEGEDSALAATFGTLESSMDPSAPAWDQFEENKRRFQVETTYNESLYTTTLNLSELSAADQAKATQKAEEIVNEKRRTMSDCDGSDHEGDEEDKYCAVMRPQLGDAFKAREEIKGGDPYTTYHDSDKLLTTPNSVGNSSLDTSFTKPSMSAAASPRFQNRSRDRFVHGSIDALMLEPPAVSPSPQDVTQIKDKIFNCGEQPKEGRKLLKESENFKKLPSRGKGTHSQNGPIPPAKHDHSNSVMSEPLVDALQSTATNQHAPPCIPSRPPPSKSSSSPHPPYTISTSSAPSLTSSSAHTAAPSTRPNLYTPYLPDGQPPTDESSLIDKPFQFNPNAPEFDPRPNIAEVSTDRHDVGSIPPAQTTTSHATSNSPANSSPQAQVPSDSPIVPSGGAASPTAFRSTNKSSTASPLVTPNGKAVSSSSFVQPPSEDALNSMQRSQSPRRIPAYAVNQMTMTPQNGNVPSGNVEMSYTAHPPDLYVGPAYPGHFANANAQHGGVDEVMLPTQFSDRPMEASDNYFQQLPRNEMQSVMMSTKLLEHPLGETKSLKDALKELVKQVKNEVVTDNILKWDSGEKDANKLLNDVLNESIYPKDDRAVIPPLVPAYAAIYAEPNLGLPSQNFPPPYPAAQFGHSLNHPYPYTQPPHPIAPSTPHNSVALLSPGNPHTVMTNYFHPSSAPPFTDGVHHFPQIQGARYYRDYMSQPLQAASRNVTPNGSNYQYAPSMPTDSPKAQVPLGHSTFQYQPMDYYSHIVPRGAHMAYQAVHPGGVRQFSHGQAIPSPSPHSGQQPMNATNGYQISHLYPNAGLPYHSPVVSLPGVPTASSAAPPVPPTIKQQPAAATQSFNQYG